MAAVQTSPQVLQLGDAVPGPNSASRGVFNSQADKGFALIRHIRRSTFLPGGKQGLGGLTLVSMHWMVRSADFAVASTDG